MIGVKCVMCMLGTAWAAIQWKKQGVKWMNHENTKVQFNIFYGLVISIGASYALLYAFEFARLRFPCFAFDFRIVLVLRSAGLSSIVAAHYIIVSISFERLFSSLHPKRFERWSDRYWPAVVIGAIIVSLTFVSIFCSTSHGFELFSMAKEVGTIDLKIDENAKNYEIIFDVLTYTFAGSALTIGVVCYMNFYKNKLGGTNELVIKYQYSENRKVLATLLPLYVTYAGMSLFATLCQWIHNSVDFNFSFIQRALFVEGTALSPVYPLAFALIIEWRVTRRKKPSIVDIKVEQARDCHFDELNRIWN